MQRRVRLQCESLERENTDATQKHFLQVLEGDRQNVNDTFIRIARDDRHDAVELIGFGPIETRMYPGWSMRGIGVFDLNKEIELQLVSKFGEEDDTVRIPLVEWEALSLINDVQHSRRDNMEVS